MGCSDSRYVIGDNTDSLSNIFKVVVLDTKGRDSLYGQVEISSRELLLHRNDAPSIGWPLAGLRHYGFNDNLFSFECGRRCPTGEGVYAFKCSRAEALFNLLQERIIEVAEEGRLAEPRHCQATLQRRLDGSSRGTANRLDLGSSLLSQCNHVDDQTMRSNLHMYLNTSHEYENRSTTLPDVVKPHPISYADLDLTPQPRTTINCSCQGSNENSCSYVNVPYSNLCVAQEGIHIRDEGKLEGRQSTLGDDSSRNTCFCYNVSQAQYVNFGSQLSTMLHSNRVPSVARSMSSREACAGYSLERKCSLGLKASDEPLSYTSIDIEKTLALSNTKQAICEDTALRRTRHSVSTTTTTTD